jgi:hypothetical protein
VGRTDARKPIAAALVLLLHVGLLTVFLQRDRWTWPERRSTAADIVFVNIAPPAPAPPRPERENHQRERRPVRTAAPAVAPFVVQPFAAPSTRAPNDLSDLHGQLFRCAPETLADLTPEDRARCKGAAGGIGQADPNAIPWPNNKYAPTKNTWRWARNVQRKNAPPLLPCASPQGISPIATALCLANAAVNGFDVEHKPEYFDKPEQVGVPNGGDPPMTPEH